MELLICFALAYAITQSIGQTTSNVAAVMRGYPPPFQGGRRVSAATGKAAAGTARAGGFTVGGLGSLIWSSLRDGARSGWNTGTAKYHSWSAKRADKKNNNQRAAVKDAPTLNSHGRAHPHSEEQVDSLKDAPDVDGAEPLAVPKAPGVKTSPVTPEDIKVHLGWAPNFNDTERAVRDQVVAADDARRVDEFFRTGRVPIFEESARWRDKSPFDLETYHFYAKLDAEAIRKAIQARATEDDRLVVTPRGPFTTVAYGTHHIIPADDSSGFTIAPVNHTSPGGNDTGRHLKAVPTSGTHATPAGGVTTTTMEKETPMTALAQSASGETTTMDATTAFLQEMANHMVSQVGAQLENCHAQLATRNMDPATLADIASLQEQATVLANTFTNTARSIQDRHGLMHEAVNNTAHAADTDFYRNQ